MTQRMIDGDAFWSWFKKWVFHNTQTFHGDEKGDLKVIYVEDALFFTVSIHAPP